MSEKKGGEPKLHFENQVTPQRNLEFVPTNDIIGSGIDQDLFQQMMGGGAHRHRIIGDRSQHPTKKYVTRAVRVKKRRAAKQARKMNRHNPQSRKRGLSMCPRSKAA